MVFTLQLRHALKGWPTENISSKIAGQVKNLNIEDHLNQKEIRRTARFTQLAIIAARQAVAEAGLSLKAGADGDGVDRDRVGICNGTSLGSFTDMVEQIHGMDITFVTTTNKDNQAFALLRELGMPFRGDDKPIITQQQ